MKLRQDCTTAVVEVLALHKAMKGNNPQNMSAELI